MKRMKKLAHFTIINGITPGLGKIPNSEQGIELSAKQLHKSGNTKSMEVIAETRKQQIIKRMKLIKQNINVEGPIRTNTDTTTFYHPYQPI
jgi:hypothetical protein